MMEDRFAAIDVELLRLTGKSRPRVCVIPTPTGDAQEVLERFYAAYDPWCEAYQLTPFRKTTPRSVSLRGIADQLRTFDAVFVTGGSTKSALGVWREWGIDADLRAAYNAGVLLCGMSAGAICWFEQGFTDSFNDGYWPLAALGVLKGGCSAHHAANTPRSKGLEQAIQDGSMPQTLAIDDYAAVLFHDEEPSAIYCWRPGAGVRILARGADARVTEQTLAVPTVDLMEGAVGNS